MEYSRNVSEAHGFFNEIFTNYKKLGYLQEKVERIYYTCFKMKNLMEE